MKPPKGFNAILMPLRHRFEYSVGLQVGSDSLNSTMMTFVKNYKSVNAPSTIIVNPHHASFETETGAICAPMSIIDRIKIQMTFTLTEDAIADGIEALKVNYLPVFTSFPDKMDSADDKTTTTAKAILNLTPDATEEDVHPTFTTLNLTKIASVSFAHPVSTANFTEVFGTLGLSVDLDVESTGFNPTTLFQALKYYTNKGAIGAMIGKYRSITLTKTHPTKTVFINKFVPRPVRRIVPYSFFGMILHCPIYTNREQPFYTGAMTAAKIAVGIKTLVTYDEWHLDHNQDMA